VLVALGEALLAAENLPAAIAELQRALRADPGHVRARFLTGGHGWKRARRKKRWRFFRTLDAQDVPGLADIVARAEAIKNAARSDAGYVRHLFDQFSAAMTAAMWAAGLRRAANPGRVGRSGDGGRGDLRILDLGCGTGLAGLAFQSRALRLDGIDLSPAMIEKARARGDLRFPGGRRSGNRPASRARFMT